LHFLGEVSDQRAGEVEAALRVPLAIPPFNIELTGAGMFPASGPPRAVWLGIASGARELGKVYETLAMRLDPLGFPAERRPYAAHLTVGRIKQIRRPDVPAFRQVVTSTSRPITAWNVKDVVLFRSRLSPRGARYEQLLRVPLG
jgi:2'-5' RNA ligase